MAIKIIALLSLSFCSVLKAQNYYKHLDVNRYFQDESCWCSITAIEMWADWLNGNSYTPGRQKELADKYLDDSNCNTAQRGLHVGEIANALEEETSNWFGRYKTSSGERFISRIVRELESDEPVIIVGNTRYSNGKVTPNKHYYLIDAFQNKSSDYSSSYKKINGFWLNDPAHGAWVLRNRVKTISPKTYISKEVLLRDIASKSGNKYYLVRD